MLPKSSAGKRKNDNSAHRYTPPEQYADINQRFGASSSGVTSLDSNQKHKQNPDYDSLGCILTQIPLMHIDFSRVPNHTSVSSNFSGPRAEHDGYMSPSLIESSYASNMDCSHGHSLVAAALKTNEKKEKYHSHCNLLSRSYKNERRANDMPFHSPGSSQQVAHQFENENEGHSKVRGVSLGFSSKIDSSTVQESSPTSSSLDQNLIEANSFCNLQQVLEQVLESCDVQVSEKKLFTSLMFIFNCKTATHFYFILTCFNENIFHVIPIQNFENRKQGEVFAI
jgi:hypothetical protein